MYSNGQRLTQTTTVYEEDLTAYYNDLKKYKPLKREVEKDLMFKYKNNNDLVARQRLITSNLRYAFSLVNRYKDYGVPLADLIEEANCGLIESIDKFDTSQDVKVITYAKWKMIDNIQRAIEKHNKLPKADLPDENSEQLDDEALLSEEFSSDMYVNDAFCDEEDDVRRENAINDVESIIGVLNEKETDFIKMYYGIKPYEKEFTYQEIGQKYGITKERTRQIIDKIMRKLRVEALMVLK